MKTIIIIDNCAYSRMACEDMLSEVNDETKIIAFECFTDYKLWDENCGGRNDVYNIIFNTSSALFYASDVVEFLKYENIRKQRLFTPAHILMLMNRSRPLMYANAILTHFMLQNSRSSSLIVLSAFLRMKISIIRTLLTTFVAGGAGALSRKINRHFSSPLKFSPGEVRAVWMMLSGEDIQSFASRHHMAVKTLYTQRTQVLEKLEL